MMEPVMEAPENIDLDLLDIPILTNKVEQHVDDPATRQDPQSDNET